MYINPYTMQTSEVQVSGYLPLVMEDPSDLKHYTVHAEPEFTNHQDYVGYTYYKLKNLDTLKREVIDQINAKFDQSSSAGFLFDTRLYASTDDELFKISAAFAMATENPDFMLFWISMDNNIVSMSNSDLKRFGKTAMEFKSGLIYQRRIDKNEVLACTDLEQLIQVAHSKGIVM